MSLKYVLLKSYAVEPGLYSSIQSVLEGGLSFASSSFITMRDFMSLPFVSLLRVERRIRLAMQSELPDMLALCACIARTFVPGTSRPAQGVKSKLAGPGSEAVPPPWLNGGGSP